MVHFVYDKFTHSPCGSLRRTKLWIVMCAADFDFNSWAAILITLLYHTVWQQA